MLQRRIWVIAIVTTASAAAIAQPAGMLCADSKLVCVAKVMRDAKVTAPLRIRGYIGAADLQVRWQLKDSGGAILTSGSTYNDPQALVYRTASTRDLDVTAYVVLPANSDRGTLVLTPLRTDTSSESMDLPGLTIPVRLETATSTLTYMWPSDVAAYDAEVDAYADEVKAAPFEPRTALIPKEVTVMKVDESARMAATAEALLRAMPGQSGPWQVKSLRVDHGTVRLQLVSDAWAGVSYYWTSIGYLLQKTLEKFPGIKEVEFK